MQENKRSISRTNYLDCNISEMLTHLHAIVLATLTILIIQATACAAVPPEQGEGYITSLDGTRIFYKVVGSGPDTLVVLHGGPGNTMLSILPDLELLAKNRTVIYYDQRGNGRSDLVEDDDSKLAISKHIEDLEALRLHFNLDKMTLIGNSWGGLLVSFYAIAHPQRVARLVLHSPASPSYSMLKASTPFIHQRIPEERISRFNTLSLPTTWLSYPDPISLCREFYQLLVPVYFSNTSRAKNMRGDVCAGPIEAVRRQLLVNKIIWYSLGEWDLTAKLQKVTAPTLIVHGSYDMIPLHSSIEWVKSMPNARLLIIEDSGHMTHIEQPQIFFTAVEEFLAERWPENAVKASEVSKDELLPFGIEILRP